MGGNVADALRIEHLSKTFPGQVALDDVALDVGAGEVHALVGQNGSGKSTLIKILAGYHQPDPATVQAWVDGRPLSLGDGQAATDARHPLRPPGSRARRHAERGREPRLDGRLHDRVRRTHPLAATRPDGTRDALEALGLADIDVKAPVDSLPPSHRTAVAIARALVGWEDGASLLVLDEPTATLPGDDVRAPVRGDPPPASPRRLDPVRLPPPRRGVRTRRPRHGAPRRTRVATDARRRARPRHGSSS